MTALIIIGIVFFTIVLHFTIGNLAALKLAPKVAEISNQTKSEVTPSDFIREYEWENNRQRSSDEYKTQWLTKNWQPTESKNNKWQSTGRSREVGQESKEELVTAFDPEYFKSKMNFIRWVWFFGVPSVLNTSADRKMIEKYDSAAVERKAKQQDARIKELEKELQMEIES